VNVYPFIGAEQAQQRNVAKVCALLKVSRSAYYDWSTHSPSARRRADDALAERITAIHETSWHLRLAAGAAAVAEQGLVDNPLGFAGLATRSSVWSGSSSALSTCSAFSSASCGPHIVATASVSSVTSCPTIAPDSVMMPAPRQTGVGLAAVSARFAGVTTNFCCLL